jgi:hypothetical protein
LPNLRLCPGIGMQELRKKREKLQLRYHASCPRFEPEPSAVRNSISASVSAFMREKRRTANISAKVVHQSGLEVCTHVKATGTSEILSLYNESGDLMLSTPLYNYIV